MEKPIKQNTCGIPQYYDQLLNQCSHKETDGVSIFLKPMEPDGVLFAFKGGVSSQPFCKDNTLIAAIRKLNGSGIMQLPTGCTLSITTESGQNTKLKGRPTSRMIDADDMVLVMNGPLTELQTQSSVNGS